jgi:adenylate kinase
MPIMNKLNDVVIVTGVSASGKDYLLSRALQGIESAGHPIIPVEFGTLLHQRMQIEAGLGRLCTRDALRDQPAEVIRRVARGVLKEVLELDGTKILNTHVMYRQGPLLVTDPETDLLVRARDYIFVSSDPEEIARRRQHDASRQRMQEDATMIGIHQQTALGVVTAITTALNSGLTVIHNTPEQTAENVELIRSTIVP